MSEHSQLNLFPMTVQEIFSVIPLFINPADPLSGDQVSASIFATGPMPIPSRTFFLTGFRGPGGSFLPGINFDFCPLARNRVNRPEYETLGKEWGLGLLQVVMPLGQDVLSEQINDEEALLRAEMKSPADQARSEIVPSSIRGHGGLPSLYEAFRRSRQSEPSPADYEQIIQLSKRNAFRWREEGCRVSR